MTGREGRKGSGKSGRQCSPRGFNTLRVLPAFRQVGGIGRVAEQVLNQALGIELCGQLLERRGLLVALFSAKAVSFYLEVALGLGDTEHGERIGRPTPLGALISIGASCALSPRFSQARET